MPLHGHCANDVPSQALSRGRSYAEDAINVEEHAIDVEEGITIAEEQEARANDEYAANPAYDRGINRMTTIHEAEPDMQRLTIEDYDELCSLRRAWFKRLVS
jgi:hypothetical protein